MSIDEQQQLYDQQIIFALEQQHGSKDKALIALNNHSARSMQAITDLKELLREAVEVLREVNVRWADKDKDHWISFEGPRTAAFNVGVLSRQPITRRAVREWTQRRKRVLADPRLKEALDG